MDLKILVIFALCGLLLFGCTGEAKTPTTPGAPASGGNAVSGANTSTGTSGSSGSSATGSSGNTSSSGAATDFSNLAYSQLAALGLPVQCDVSITSASYSMKYKIYMKGSEYRVEMPMSAAYSGAYGCKNSIVTFSKGNDLYMGCDSGQLMQAYGCDWLKITSNTTSSSSGSSGSTTSSSFTSSDLEKLPSTSFSCSAWLYDASKFTASGKVCTMDDILAGLNYTSYGAN